MSRSGNRWAQMGRLCPKRFHSTWLRPNWLRLTSELRSQVWHCDTTADRGSVTIPEIYPYEGIDHRCGGIFRIEGSDQVSGRRAPNRPARQSPPPPEHEKTAGCKTLGRVLH